jgi:hypothetical protein
LSVFSVCEPFPSIVPPFSSVSSPFFMVHLTVSVLCSFLFPLSFFPFLCYFLLSPILVFIRSFAF